MNAEWVEAIGTWFSGILIAGSLVFVWVQARQSKEQTLGAQLANYHNLYLMWFTVDRVFIQHPEMRPFFYERADISTASGEIRLRLDAVSHMIFDCFDDVYHHLEHLPQGTSQAWSVFMKDLYKHTPYLKDFLQKNEQWYSPSFIHYLKD